MTTFENHTRTQVHPQRVAVEAARELEGERKEKKRGWGRREGGTGGWGGGREKERVVCERSKKMTAQ